MYWLKIILPMLHIIIKPFTIREMYCSNPGEHCCWVESGWQQRKKWVVARF